MAFLHIEDIQAIARKFVRRAYRDLAKTADLDADQVAAAIQPTEDWIADNQASFDVALPAPFNTTATAAEKTLLFCYVAMRRVGLI